MPEEKLEHKKTITLPSGREAEIFKPKVKHLWNGNTYARTHHDPFGGQVATIAQVVKIDGVFLRVDDWRELDADDFAAVVDVVFPEAPPTGEEGSPPVLPDALT